MRTFQLDPSDDPKPDKPSAEKLLSELNPVQKKAAGHGDGPLLIVAGAGSGKTRVLTYRIAWLLQQGLAKPYNILALTFTNKAAAEMRDRIQKLIGDDAKRLWMGTFHSIFARILRVEAEHIGFTADFSIYDSDDSDRAIKGILQELGLDTREIKPREIRFRISGAKNQMITPAEYADQFIRSSMDDIAARVYQIYLNRLKQSNAMDFDDLLLKPIELFQQHPAILEKYQNHFKYLLIDEYQDTNRAQYVVSKMLASKNKNITVVGDDAQSIYSFRGADISNILNFKEDYPDAVEVPLEQNYRSTSMILKCADSVIKQNKNQLDKTLWTDNGEGDPVVLIENFDQWDEGNRVSDYIRNLKLQKGYRYNDFAILYRTNYQSRVFEEVLRRKGITYQLVGSISFYQRREVKDVVAYLRLLVNPNDEESLRRVINEPSRGIGDKSLQGVIDIARSQGRPLWEVLKEASSLDIYSRAKNSIIDFVAMIEYVRELMAKGETDLIEVARELLDRSGYVKQFIEENSHESLGRRDNVMELLNAITQHQQDQGDDASLSSFLQEVSLYSDIDDFDPDEPRVTLMTVHAAKGLEFPVVFVVGLEEELFPMGGRNGEEADIEEERRLFYVAITRAEKELFFSYVKTRTRYGDEKAMIRSRFLDEVDHGVIRNESGGSISKSGRSTFGGRTKSGGHGRYQIDYDWEKPIKTGSRKSSNPHVVRTKKSRLKSGGTTFSSSTGSGGVEYPVGATVMHQTFGPGKIVGKEGEGQETKLTVFFKKHGQKKLAVKFAKLQVLP